MEGMFAFSRNTAIIEREPPEDIVQRVSLAGSDGQLGLDLGLVQTLVACWSRGMLLRWSDKFEFHQMNWLIGLPIHVRDFSLTFGVQWRRKRKTKMCATVRTI